MAAVAFLIAYVAIAGAAVSWLVAVFYFWKTQAALAPDQADLRWLTLVAWPFAVGRLRGTARASAANANKAIAAFFICLFVAGAAWGSTFWLAVAAG